MPERKGMHRKELLAVGVLLAAAVLMLIGFRIFFPGNGTAAAMVSIDGKEVMKIDLSEDRDYEIDLSGEYRVGVVLQVKDHKIRFEHSDCPDQICMGYGYIGREPESAVCMPNRVAVVISSE